MSSLDTRPPCPPICRSCPQVDMCMKGCPLLRELDARVAALEERIGPLDELLHWWIAAWVEGPKQAAQSRESDKTPAGVEPAPQQPRSCKTCFRWTYPDPCGYCVYCEDEHLPMWQADPEPQEQPRSGGG